MASTEFTDSVEAFYFAMPKEHLLEIQITQPGRVTGQYRPVDVDTLRLEKIIHPLECLPFDVGIKPDALVLFNESFAATNEREGSEIARQILSALLERHIKVFFVTHLYEFPHDFYEQQMDDAIFLRAERQADGTRTFKLIEGEPLQTSYGEDVYDEVFGYIR